MLGLEQLKLYKILFVRKGKYQTCTEFYVLHDTECEIILVSNFKLNSFTSQSRALLIQ